MGDSLNPEPVRRVGLSGRGWLLLWLLALGCSSSRSLVSVRVTRTPTGHQLILVPATEARINARLRPTLERPDGRVLYFEAPQVTPDSAYYAAEPVLDLPDPGPPRGLIRVGVCPVGERVCQVVRLTL